MIFQLLFEVFVYFINGFELLLIDVVNILCKLFRNFISRLKNCCFLFVNLFFNSPEHVHNFLHVYRLYFTVIYFLFIYGFVLLLVLPSIGSLTWYKRTALWYVTVLAVLIIFHRWRCLCNKIAKSFIVFNIKYHLLIFTLHLIRSDVYLCILSQLFGWVVLK